MRVEFIPSIRKGDGNKVMSKWPGGLKISVLTGSGGRNKKYEKFTGEPVVCRSAYSEWMWGF